MQSTLYFSISSANARGSFISSSAAKIKVFPLQNAAVCSLNDISKDMVVTDKYEVTLFLIKLMCMFAGCGIR